MERILQSTMTSDRGLSSDEGNGDAWPSFAKRFCRAASWLFATATWLRQPSSIAKRVLERVDAAPIPSPEQARRKALKPPGRTQAEADSDAFFACLPDRSLFLECSSAPPSTSVSARSPRLFNSLLFEFDRSRSPLGQ